jgi:hypothetical protein
LSLHRPTWTPPVGAGPLNVTVPVEGVPPATEVGSRDRLVSATEAPTLILTHADTFTPSYAAEIVVVVTDATAVVVTVNVAVVLPAGTVTVSGTIAEELLLDSAAVMPPAGAGAFRVNVPVDGDPPVTDVGLNDTEDSPAPAVMVSAAVLTTLLYVPVIVAVADDVTAIVVTVKFAAVLPAATVTLAGTVAEGLLLNNTTVMPPAGAAAFRVTVPVEETPPITEAGLSVNEASPGPEPPVTVRVVVMAAPL